MSRHRVVKEGGAFYPEYRLLFWHRYESGPYLCDTAWFTNRQAAIDFIKRSMIGSEKTTKRVVWTDDDK